MTTTPKFDPGLRQFTANEYLNQGSGKITLCGSTKFFFEAMQSNKILTFRNWKVWACGSWGHSFDLFAEKDLNHDYAVVKKLHFDKIFESDCIVVVFDKTGYMGDSTNAEIAYAEFLNKPVFYYNGINFIGWTYLEPPKPDKKAFNESLKAFLELNKTLGY